MRSVEEGHYARKQLGSRSSIIRWSHAARFQQGVRLAESRPTEKLLDYGCGDGTFLSLMSDKFNAAWEPISNLNRWTIADGASQRFPM